MIVRWRHFRVVTIAGVLLCLGVTRASSDPVLLLPAAQEKPDDAEAKVGAIPYSPRAYYFHRNSLGETPYLSELVPDVLLPLGKRPEVKKPKEAKKEASMQKEEAPVKTGDKAVEFGPQPLKAGESPEKMKAEEKGEHEPAIAPFLTWIKEREDAAAMAKDVQKRYERRSSMDPEYDRANRVLFEMRFPYSGYRADSASGSSAVIYSTPKRK